MLNTKTKCFITGKRYNGSSQLKLFDGTVVSQGVSSKNKLKLIENFGGRQFICDQYMLQYLCRNISMKIIGLDIGGANTDCSIIEFNEEYEIVSIKNDREYFPMWKNNDKLRECLKKFIKNDDEIDIVCVSMTAELSDGYESKIEGVLDISNKVIEVFKEQKVYFVTFEGLKTFNELKNNPLIAAAANWIGTSEIIKYIKEDCIFMDIGSTTTDIIPIKNKRECALGHSDLERLSSGELIYTGMLRTNLAAIVHHVPVYGKNTRVSSEYFAISADVHRILGNISEKDYTCNTPDGKNTDITSCKRRLSRLVCADLDTLKDDEIINLAKYIEKKQIQQIYKGLNEVVQRTNLNNVVITSIGEGNLCEKASRKLNLNIISLDKHMPKKATNVLTTLGAVQMYLDTLDKKIIIPEKMGY